VYKLDGGYDSLKIVSREGVLYSTYLQDLLADSPLISTGNNRFRTDAKGPYNIGYEFLPGEKGEIKYLNLGQLMWVKQ
jgi:hypothetical protein